MRKKLIRIGTAVLLLLLSTAVISFYVHRRAVQNELSQRYYEALQPDRVRVYTNPFSPEAQMAHYDSILAVSPPGYARIGQYLKATDLMELGREKDAIDVLEKIGPPTASVPDRLAADVRSTTALAWLRMGERNNCIHNHSTGSCVFPIRNDGVYADPYASRHAIDGYQQILQENPNDLTPKWLLNIAYMT